MSRSISALHPDLCGVALDYLNKLRSIGVYATITQTWRSSEEQRALYQKGRDENGNIVAPSLIVTNARPGRSPHEVTDHGVPCAMAFDIAFLQGTKIVWEGPWATAGAVGAEIMGLTWGGTRKSFCDRPHFELKGWKTKAASIGWEVVT